MKRIIAAITLTLAGAAHAQVQTYCNDMGSQTVCQSYNTGAPQIQGSSSETVNYGGRQYQVRTYGQPAQQAPQAFSGVNWGLLQPPPVVPYHPR